MQWIYLESLNTDCSTYVYHRPHTFKSNKYFYYNNLGKLTFYFNLSQIDILFQGDILTRNKLNSVKGVQY